MKKLLIVMLALICALGFTGCSADKEAESTGENAATARPEAVVYPDEEIVRMVTEAIGPELMARAKDAGYLLEFDFRSYDYKPTGESDPDRPDSFHVTISFESPMGSNEFENNTVDIELMSAVHSAIIDSGVFVMVDEDKAAFKANYYGSEDQQSELRGDNGVSMSIVQTPTRSSILVQIQGFYTTEPGIVYASDLFSLGYIDSWRSIWNWDVLDSRR